VRAITDSLSGLYNHAHFYQRLAEEIERSKRYGRGFTVVMMDVDNFKQYNDSPRPPVAATNQRMALATRPAGGQARPR
jgi:predicted signal transduction protein with EAL and GGDEF domain